MIRILFLLCVVLFCNTLKAQTTNAAVSDSLFKVFPNPTHNQFFVTTQGRVVYGMLIASNGSKREEYTPYEIPSFQNQFGIGCTQAGCVGGTYVISNFICTLQRKVKDDGLYYLILFDDLGHIYHTMIVFN